MSLEARSLSAYFSNTAAVKEVSVAFAPNTVTAIIGPSGCGKSTFVRCLNRMHEEVPGAWVRGKVLLDGVDLYKNGTDPVIIRRKIGMVFQKANPFPGLSVFENVEIGVKLAGLRSKPV